MQLGFDVSFVCHHILVLLFVFMCHLLAGHDVSPSATLWRDQVFESNAQHVSFFLSEMSWILSLHQGFANKSKHILVPLSLLSKPRHE
jgi:hypothetical protein